MKFFQSFFLGIFGALGALFLEIIILTVSSPLSSNAEVIVKDFESIGLFFFLAILAEEFSKYILIYKFHGRENSNSNIVLNSLFFGIGFSMLEAFLIYWNYQNENIFDLMGFSGIIIVHISTAMLIGYSMRKNKTNLMPSLFFGFIPALLIHLSYNLLKITKVTHQKELTIILLILLIFVNVFLLFKSIFSQNMEKI